jgi:hypothetical protein
MSSPAAWHPDPLGRHEHRYWDGTQWTEHVADGGRSGHDPIDATPSGATGDAPQPTTASEGSSGDPAPETPTAVAEPTPSDQAGQAQGPGQFHQPPSQQPQPQGAWQAAGPANQPPPTNGLAVAAMIIGILSLLISWIPFVGLLGVVGGGLALLLGLLGRGRAKKIANGGGLAVTGVITGLLAVLVGIASTVLPVLFFQGRIGDFEAVDRCIEQTGDEQFCLDEHAPGWVRFLDGIDD